MFRRGPTGELETEALLRHEQSDLRAMRRAIAIAKGAKVHNDIPFGCVILDSMGREVANAAGTGTANPVRHSELEAITAACNVVEAKAPKWLTGYTLISTHEPCIMCCGGINHAKISRVVFGTYRSDLAHLFRTRAVSVAVRVLLAETTHPPEVIGGIMRQECIQLFDGVKKWDLVE